MLQKYSKWRVLGFPLGIVVAMVMAVASEIFAVPILTPLAFLPVIIGLIVLAPLLSVAAGKCYEKIFKGGIQGTIIAASLRYRASAIGLSVVLLFCVCTVSTVTVGLANAGLGQVTEGQSFWRPGIHWGSVRDDANVREIYRGVLMPGVLGTFGQGRIVSEEKGTSTNAFIMSCKEYSLISADAPVCPLDETDSIMIPEGSDSTKISNVFYSPVEDKEIQLPSLSVKEVSGLTEIIISTSDDELNKLGQYVYADLNKIAIELLYPIVTNTYNGLTSQERIDGINAETISGYRIAALTLVLSIVLFGLASIIGIVIAALRDRRDLMETLTIRGIEKAVAKKLIRIETVSLTLPFVVFGCAAGVILAAVIAKASSLEPSDTITPYILLILFLYLVSVPVTTEVWLYRMRRKND